MISRSGIRYLSEVVSRTRSALALGVLTSLVVAPSLSAQQMTSVRADELTSGLTLLGGRDSRDIRDDLEIATEAGFRLEAEVRQLEGLLAEAKAKVEIKKSEIEIIETERDLADRQDREVDKKALEREKEYEEAQKEVLEAYVDLREREIEWAKARRESAKASVEVHERELTLTTANGELQSAQSSGVDFNRVVRLEREASQREKELLERLRDRARRFQTEAERERRVYEAQLEVIDKRRRLGEIES